MRSHHIRCLVCKPVLGGEFTLELISVRGFILQIDDRTDIAELVRTFENNFLDKEVEE